MANTVETGHKVIETAEVSREIIETLESKYDVFTRAHDQREIILDCAGFDDEVLIDISNISGVSTDNLRDNYTLFWTE